MKLTPEVLEEIQNQYPKVIHLEVDGDDYVFRYPTKMEAKNIRNLAEKAEKLTVGKAKGVDEESFLNIVNSLCVFPDAEVYQAALEIDGFLGELLAANVLNIYFNRKAKQKDNE